MKQEDGEQQIFTKFHDIAVNVLWWGLRTIVTVYGAFVIMASRRHNVQLHGPLSITDSFHTPLANLWIRYDLAKRLINVLCGYVTSPKEYLDESVNPKSAKKKNYFRYLFTDVSRYGEQYRSAKAESDEKLF